MLVAPTARAALIEIAALLAPGEPDVAARVTAAHDDPAAYVAEHADQLDGRGIDTVVPDLAWIALVDALADHDLLAEVDWKEAADEVFQQLRQLRSSPAMPDSWGESDLPTFDFLELTGTRVRDIETRLAVLDIESDCYPLVLVPAALGEQLTSLADAAGFRAHLYG
jgi:Family of unknown function (DUF6630)